MCIAVPFDENACLFHNIFHFLIWFISFCLRLFHSIWFTLHNHFISATWNQKIVLPLFQRHRYNCVGTFKAVLRIVFKILPSCWTSNLFFLVYLLDSSLKIIFFFPNIPFCCRIIGILSCTIIVIQLRTAWIRSGFATFKRAALSSGEHWYLLTKIFALTRNRSTVLFLRLSWCKTFGFVWHHQNSTLKTVD